MEDISKLLKILNVDRIITGGEVKELLSAIVNILNKFKEETKEINLETIKIVEDSFEKYVALYDETKKESVLSQEEIKKATLLAQKELNKIKREVQGIYDSNSALILDIEDGKTPIKGVDYLTPEEIDQLMADVKKIIAENKNEVEELSPEEIRDSLSSLEGDNRLDAKHIKNIPMQFVGTGSYGSGTGGGTGDVSGPASSADGDIVVFDGPTGKIIKDTGIVSSEVLTTDNVKTVTNKRITSRVGSITTSGTPTIDTDLYDVFEITALAEDITSFTTNLTGTPTDGQQLAISITGTGSFAITWGASFENSSILLPTSTFGTNRLDVVLVWNSATSKWRCVGSTAQYYSNTFKGCSVYHSTTQSISTTLVAVQFNSELYDNDTMHDNSTNNTRITFNTPGKYHVSGYLSTDGNAVVRTQIRLNGTTIIAATATGNAGASLQGASVIVRDYEFSAGDYIELLGYFGSAVNALGGISGTQLSVYQMDY